MVLIEMDALSGYQFDEEKVQNLVRSKIRKVDLQNSNTHLVLYLDEVR